MGARRLARGLAAGALAVLAACGGPEPQPASPSQRNVSGVVMKGAVESASVSFFNVDAAGNPTTLVATVSTDAAGSFLAALPNEDVHLLAQTFGGSYLDESDPAPAASRRRITLPSSPTAGFEAVLPPGVTSFAITPYSHALLIKARQQAAGLNFANVFDAVRLQATAAFGFDPITTIPADPTSPAAAATRPQLQYALLLGAASQAINFIATSAGHLPGFADVVLFIDDLGLDGTFDLIALEEQLRRFRNNNLALYAGVPLPVVDEVLLAQPATVPNEAPVANPDAIAVVEGGTATVLSDGSTASVLANDTDAEGSTLAAAVATAPGAGVLTLNTDGTFTYAHDGSEGPADSFTYVANDGTDDSVPATVTIAVSAVNDPPVAVADPGYTGAVGGTVTALAGAGGVRDNDTDPDHATTSLVVTTTPTSAPSFAASFSLSADGSFTYTHDGSANLVDSFTYEVCDTGVPVECNTAVATITVSAGGGGQTMLPFLNSAGELWLFDAGDPASSVMIESGLSTSTFSFRTLMRADVTASVASNITPARIVYVSGDRTIQMVNLEAGQPRTPVQVSNILDACRINGVAEDFVNPDNSIIRVDTAGDNGICEDGSGDDSTTAAAWLVPLSTAAGSPGVGIGEGHCCGITGIGTTSGTLAGVLVAEDDDGSDGTFFLRRRNVGSLATPAFSTVLQISGSGQVYGSLQRGMGDTHIYVRAVRDGVDSTYKLLRFNVATNTLTSVYDFGVSDATLFDEPLDHAVFDANNLYFAEFDGSVLLCVSHLAANETSFTSLFTPPGGTKINGFAPTSNRIVIEASSADGTQGGVFSVLKITGGPQTLATNSALPSTTRLSGVNGALVLMDTISGTGPAYTATARLADGTGTPSNISDAQWAGEVFQTTCDFNADCDDTVLAQTLYVRRQASTSNAQLELADTTTGAPTGTYVGTVPNAFEGPAAFVLGFGQYGQVTVFAASEQADIYLADSTQAAASPPAGALATVANAPGAGDNRWLLFGDGGDDGGGGGGTDSDFDGLTDAEEIALGTDPNDDDSDDDGLLDGFEVNTSLTSPLAADTDDDALSDGDEFFLVGTNANNPDTDGDGVGDGIEVDVGADPLGTINPVVYVDPTAGCSASCNGTSWALAWPNEFNVEGTFNVSGTDAANTAFVLFRDGTSYGPLDLTGVDRKHVAYVGSVGPGVYAPAWPPTTIFSGSGSSRALTLNRTVAVEVAHVRFENGFHATIGGGVYLSTPLNTEFGFNSVFLRRVEVAGNTAGVNGGGAVADGANNTLNFVGSSIIGNQAQGGASAVMRGGGLFMQAGGQVMVSDSLISGNTVTCAGAGCSAVGGGGTAVGAGGTLFRIENSIVEGNTATSGASLSSIPGGGGLAVQSSAVLQVIGSDVRNNTAIGQADSVARGGGLYAELGDLQVEDSRIAGNVVSAATSSPPFGGGGGVYASVSSTASLLRNIIADNKAQAGPGGGVNFVGVFTVLIQDNKFLSNSSLNPGGGLHMHPDQSPSVFNNLFVGNVAVDSVAEGGAVELDVTGGNVPIFFESNTVAYNQLTAASGGGGGISVKSTSATTLDLNNNNIWFNQDSTPAAANAGDNYLAGGALAVASSGNNVDDANLTAGNPAPADPVFVQGFYLDPATSPSVDAGDDAFAGPLLGPVYVTDPAGAGDFTPVDIGFHHLQAASGAYDGLIGESPTTCGEFSVRPTFANAPNGEPGHLVSINPLGAVSLGSLTSIDPPGAGDVIAWDRGDGSYSFNATGPNANVDFEVYVDGLGTVFTTQFFVQGGC